MFKTLALHGFRRTAHFRFLAVALAFAFGLMAPAVACATAATVRAVTPAPVEEDERTAPSEPIPAGALERCRSPRRPAQFRSLVSRPARPAEGSAGAICLAPAFDFGSLLRSTGMRLPLRC